MLVGMLSLWVALRVAAIPSVVTLMWSVALARGRQLVVLLRLRVAQPKLVLLSALVPPVLWLSLQAQLEQKLQVQLVLRVQFR